MFHSIVASEQEGEEEEEEDDNEEEEGEEEEDDENEEEDEDEDDEADEKNLKKIEQQRAQGKVRGFSNVFCSFGVRSHLSYQLISCLFSLCKSKWHQERWR